MKRGRGGGGGEEKKLQTFNNSSEDFSSVCEAILLPEKDF